MTPSASHYCRALIRESHNRGRHPFAFTLLEWAGNTRRREQVKHTTPKQGELAI